MGRRQCRILLAFSPTIAFGKAEYRLYFQVIDRAPPSPFRSRQLAERQANQSPAETRTKNRRRALLREARRLRAARKDRIFGCFVRGMSHDAIASVENCSAPAVRKLIARELADRRIDPAGDFAKLQVARLNEALIAANMKMLEGDLAALDRVVKIVAELDRYHGLAQALERRESAARPLALAAPPPPAPPSLPAPERGAEEREGQIRIARF
jgi:hypothetical protein